MKIDSWKGKFDFECSGKQNIEYQPNLGEIKLLILPFSHNIKGIKASPILLLQLEYYKVALVLG